MNPATVVKHLSFPPSPTTETEGADMPRSARLERGVFLAKEDGARYAIVIARIVELRRLGMLATAARTSIQQDGCCSATVLHRCALASEAIAEGKDVTEAIMMADEGRSTCRTTTSMPSSVGAHGAASMQPKGTWGGGASATSMGLSSSRSRPRTPNPSNPANNNNMRSHPRTSDVVVDDDDDEYDAARMDVSSIPGLASREVTIASIQHTQVPELHLSHNVKDVDDDDDDDDGVKVRSSSSAAASTTPRRQTEAHTVHSIVVDDRCHATKKDEESRRLEDLAQSVAALEKRTELLQHDACVSVGLEVLALRRYLRDLEARTDHVVAEEDGRHRGSRSTSRPPAVR